MDKDAYLEINASQRPALALFEAMGYTYISPADCDKQRGSRYHVLLRDILRGQLRRLNRYVYAGAENEFSAANIERAMEDLDEPLTDGLVRISRISSNLRSSSWRPTRTPSNMRQSARPKNSGASGRSRMTNGCKPG